MVIFTLITGLASILSLFLPLVDNLKKWKIYFYYLGLLFLGVTIGIIASMAEKSLNTINSDQLLSLLTMLAVASAFTFCAVLLIKRDKESWGYILLAGGLGIYLPLNMEKLNHHKNDITSTELIFLIKNDEDKGDFSRAIELLTIYKSRVEENDSKRFDANIYRKKDIVVKAETTQITKFFVTGHSLNCVGATPTKAKTGMVELEPEIKKGDYERQSIIASFSSSQNRSPHEPIFR